MQCAVALPTSFASRAGTREREKGKRGSRSREGGTEEVVKAEPKGMGREREDGNQLKVKMDVPWG